MSIPVDLGALQEQISRCGPNALLVTTSSTGTAPHISSVIVSVEAGHLAIGVGKTARANAAEHPEVALVWTNGLDDGYCMIVDAVALATATATATDSAALRVEPKSAVLHRLADAPSDLPRCAPVGDA